MSSTYTCTACSKALLRSSSSLLQRTHRASLRQARRTISTTSPTSYYASQHLSADVRPEAIKKPHPAVASGVTGLAQRLREKAPLMTETYVAYGATRDLIKECTKPGEYKIPQALLKRGEIPVDENGVHLGEGEGWWYDTLGLKPGEYKIPQALLKRGEIPVDENGVHLGEGEGWWYDTLGLKPTFSNWAQITFIHMYMLQVRFRMFPQSHAPVWIQHLTNQAFYAAEDRLVIWHKFNANSLRQKHLKDMFSQWRAVLLSYDEGLMKGDAMLAAAVWRNLLGAKEDVDFEKLAQIVGYMRKELKRLDNATDDEVANGTWTFKGSPGDEANVVKAPSRMMATETAKA